MKIAACLSGNSRTAVYCRPYIERFFRGHEVDWHVHAWPNDISHLELYEPVSVSLSLPPADLLDKERKAIERFREYCFIRTIPMYWGIKESIGLVDSDKYDLLVRLRPDIVPLQRLEGAMKYFDSEAISFAYHMQVPLRAWSPPQKSALVNTTDSAFNDLLFYGRPEKMKAFTKIYDYIDEFCADPEAKHFYAGHIFFRFLKRYTDKQRRVPISLYLINEANTKRPLVAYQQDTDRPKERNASMLEYTAERMPDLVDLMRNSPTLTPEETWFSKAWAEGPISDCGPIFSASVQRLAQQSYDQYRRQRPFLQKLGEAVQKSSSRLRRLS